MTALHVMFRVGNADYALPANEVMHLDSFETATHIPGAPSYVAGLVQIRGRLIPVIDLRARFGLAPAEASLDRRVLVVQAGSRVAGLLVDSAREVRQLDETAFEKPPEVVAKHTSGFVKAVATITDRMYLLVDLPRLIGEDAPHGQ